MPRKIIGGVFQSIDGVMQAPGGPEEDPTGGFEHGGWSAGYWDELMEQVMGETMGKPFDLVLGRRTYEIFAAHWPYAEGPAADALNGATKHVASRTLDTVEWQRSHLIEGDVPDGVRRLKEQDGPELQVHGSAGLLQTLIAHGLVDEFHVWTFPVVVGGGKRLFGDGLPGFGLELVDSRTSGTGVVIATYRPAGEIKAGSFAAAEPSEAEVARREKLRAEG
ncbi:MAG TPA: dihydrofolate reductase family protein [Solirubrobacteraceae bacterium]|nr:dihydrofolate reductase family protein [Solirubrobacteraceae bacterium]